MLCCLFFFLLLRLPPGSTLFPYTTLFRSCAATRATWRDAAPTRRACGSRGRSVCRPLRMVVEEAAADPRVGVDPAVAQKRPAAPHFLDAPEVEIGRAHV